MALVDPDSLTDAILIRKLRNNECFLTKPGDTKKSDQWEHLSEISYQNSDGAAVLVEAWVACKYCKFKVFRTHAKLNKQNHRRNWGITTAVRHAEDCGDRKGAGPIKQDTLTKFAYRKKDLSPADAESLKTAETAYVVSGLQSFLSVEDPGLIHLAQVLINLGAKYGKLDVRDIWYGRKSVRDKLLIEYDVFAGLLKTRLAPFIPKRQVSCTTDLWTDDQLQRSFLDVSVFWVDDTFKLNHAMARCKLFEPHRKTAVNIKNELQIIFNEFGLPISKTSTTTDSGANIVAALNDEFRIACMNHRFSTVINDAWDRTKAELPALHNMDVAVKAVTTYVHHSSGIQESLPMTIKKSSQTRPWRGFDTVYRSFFTSFTALRNILEERHEEDRVQSISITLLKALADFFRGFNAIFDSMETSVKPSLQMALPSYYLVADIICAPDETDHAVVARLKKHIITGMDKKYFTSVSGIHQVATLLDPSFRTFEFISNPKDRQMLHRDAKAAAMQIAGEVAVPSPAAAPREPPPKKARLDPFQQLRLQGTTNQRTVEPDYNSQMKDELRKYLSDHHEVIYDVEDPLSFWKQTAHSYPALSQLAKRIFVCQASSAESERHFSIAGQVVDEKRATLGSDCIEAQTVLKEAVNNGLWPDITW